MSRPAQIRAITARDRTQTRDTAAAWLDAHGITAATAQEYRAARAEALALAEARIASDTRAIIDYVVTRYVLRTRAVKPGRKTAPRTLADEHRIASAYFAELARARESHEADSRQPRDVAAVALRRTAAAYGISRRTVERIVAGLAAT